ncbi:MAG: tetratricopeptide repeat protein [Candidatus Omnitrophota bacterium]
MEKEKSLSLSVSVALLLLLGCLIYSNTLNAPFYFDDQHRIIRNLSLRPSISLERIWESFPTRFVANISFALQYSLTGLSPWGFHLTNLLIHLLAALAVFGIARSLLRTPALKNTLPASHQDLFALGTAFLFVAHPIQTQAVTYVVQRMTSLAALFYLATLWFYLKARLENTRYFWSVSLFMLLAMLTKEISITLPFTILLIDVCFFPFSPIETVSKKLRRWIPFAACLLIIPLIFITFPEHLIGNLPPLDDKIYRWDYLLTQFRVIRTYLRLLFFPIDQCLDYEYPLSTGWGDLNTWSAFFLLLGIFSLAIALFKKYRLLSFGILFFFLTLIPESSFFPAKDVIFEHRLYLPMVGFCFFAASVLTKFIKTSGLFRFVLIALALILGTLTYRRNAVWANELLFWQDQTRAAPLQSRGYFHLGETYNKNHQYLLAADSFLKALSLKSPGQRNDIHFNNVGSAYANAGQISKAKYWYHKGLEAYPRSGTLYTNLAVLKMREGDLESAASLLKTAIASEPESSIAHYELARIYVLKKEYPQAISLLERAITLDPFLRPAHELLATLQELQKNQANPSDLIGNAEDL